MFIFLNLWDDRKKIVEKGHDSTCYFHLIPVYYE
jgi:hypothetical protein